MTLVCWNCGASLDDIPRPISRHATCAACFNELHCCRMCKHFDPQRNMQCFEDRADPPLQKENANFCDYFIPASGAFLAQNQSKASSARSELDALFGAEQESAGSEITDAANDEVDGQVGDQLDAGPNVSPPEEDAAGAAQRKLDDLFN
ncbi:MAG: hypothetical protein AAF529_23035 [Pseudomonadota bacterium]